MIKKIQTLLKNYFVKQLVMYVGYIFFAAVFYLVLISIISFFHFMLGHKLSEIQEWILGYGWQLIILSKLIAFFCIFQIIGLDASYRDLYEYVIEKKMKRIDRDVLILTLFSILFFVILKKPVAIIHHQFQIIRFILALVGISVFYVSDLVLIMALQIIYPVDKRGLFVRLILFSAMFLIGSKLTYTFAEEMNIFVWGQFFATMYLLNLDRNNYLSTLIFIVSTSSVYVFLGGDPVWGSLFSVFKLETPVSISEVFYWLIIFVLYFKFKKSKFIFKIKRKIRLLTT